MSDVLIHNFKIQLGNNVTQGIEEKIFQLINKQNVAYISSVDSDGFPNMKAMLAPRKCEDNKKFYFTTNTSSMRVRQYRDNSKACIYFCNEEFFESVLFKGYIDVLEDTYSKEMIWQDGDTAYYSQGVTDPDYCVLRFTAKSGRFYSNFKSYNFCLE